MTIIRKLEDFARPPPPVEGDFFRTAPGTLPQPPPIVGIFPAVEGERASAPSMLRFSGRPSALSVGSGSTIVAPELEAVISTGSVPPYWLSGETSN